jgi:hypothetical protein
MDNAQCFSLVKGKIEALGEESTRSPSMPIIIFIQMSEIQTERARKEIEALKRVRYNPARLQDIPAYLGSLRHLSAAWLNVQFDKPETRRVWMEKQALGEVSRFELREAIELAFYDDEIMMGKLQAINHGGSNADEIQELSDLVYLAQNNKEKLIEETELTEETINESAELAVELGQIYAKVVVDESTLPEIRVLRDKVYTIIENEMKEIERRARYAFRNSPENASLFSFSYKPAKRKNKKVVPQNDVIVKKADKEMAIV